MEIEHDNLQWIYKYISSNADVLEVSNYLKDNDLVITVRDGTSVSGFTPCHVILEGVDLSKDGFCFSGDRLLDHVRWHRTYLEATETDEYKDYLEAREQYEKIYQYFN